MRCGDDLAVDALVSGEPIVINAVQMRLAIELAAQKAAQVELRRQLRKILGGRPVTVEGFAIDMQMTWPEFDVMGREVVFK